VSRFAPADRREASRSTPLDDAPPATIQAASLASVHWAAELEHAGAHVTVGVAKLKTHAKVALVVRQEASGLRSYAHIGTGNYHVRNARLYTDVGLLTSGEALTADVVSLFHHLTGRSEMPDSRALLIAPTGMRQRFLDLIAREIDNRRTGRPNRIVAKMNQLEDPAIIAALCNASRAYLLLRGGQGRPDRRRLFHRLWRQDVSQSLERWRSRHPSPDGPRVSVCGRFSTCLSAIIGWHG